MFAIPSELAVQVRRTAEEIKRWCESEDIVATALAFEENFVKLFDRCLHIVEKHTKSNMKACGMYTTVCILPEYKICDYHDFLCKQVGISEISVIFWQFIGDYTLKELALM